MDPLSITATVASIVGVCLKTAKSLSDLRDKYQDAQMTIIAIHTESSVIGATLSKIQCLLLNNPEALTPKMQDDPQIEVKATFDIALTGFSMIYSCIEIEVEKLRSHATESGDPGWKAKSKFLWNEDTMKRHLDHLHGQQTTLTLLISVLQIETLADIHRIVKEKRTEDVLESAAVRTRSLREAYPQSNAPASIFETKASAESRFGDGASILSSATFEFDNDIVNSHVYRRTLASANQYSKDQDEPMHPDSDITSEVTRSTLQVPNAHSGQLAPSISSTLALRACSGSFMGLWSKGTNRRFRKRELRFEVIFETPVFIVATPLNNRGPLRNRPIYYIDGTDESFSNTRTINKYSDMRRNRKPDSYVQKANWVHLLEDLQGMEMFSRDWDSKHSGVKSTFAEDPPGHEIAIGIQVQEQSWDRMPPAINKPYASTALCHLIEIMAMMGVHWKYFDQASWNIRAEGNGHVLTGRMVPTLGLLASFGVTGKSAFAETRVVPCYEIKALIFGSVPCFYDKVFEYGSDFDTGLFRTNLHLEFGTSEHVHNTLKLIGCSAETIELWEANHEHLFSVAFEMIGMLGVVCRIRSSLFSYIPNPTTDMWNQQTRVVSFWSRLQLLKQLENRLDMLTLDDNPKSHITLPFTQDLTHIINIQQSEIRSRSETLTLETRERLHDMIDGIDSHLFSYDQNSVLEIISRHIKSMMVALQDPVLVFNSLDATKKVETLIAIYFDQIRPSVIQKQDSDGEDLSEDFKQQRDDIWISLLTRMICWLSLHDFDSSDVMVVPPELKGSRMPVFLS